MCYAGFERETCTAILHQRLDVNVEAKPNMQGEIRSRAGSAISALHRSCSIGREGLGYGICKVCDTICTEGDGGSGDLVKSVGGGSRTGRPSLQVLMLREQGLLPVGTMLSLPLVTTISMPQLLPLAGSASEHPFGGDLREAASV